MTSLMLHPNYTCTPMCYFSIQRAHYLPQSWTALPWLAIDIHGIIVIGDCGAIRPWSRSKGDPEGCHPKAWISKCQSIGCNYIVHSKPLQDVYNIVHGDNTSGWVRYTISGAKVL